VVGQERVVVYGGRERTLGQAQDHHQVEVEPDAHGHRTDEDSLAEAADPSQVGFELSLQGAGEDVEFDEAFDGVEGGPPERRSFRIRYRGSGLRPRWPSVSC
jgi:hypothetical protein